MDNEWHRIMRAIRDGGERRADRTGVGTLALFGVHARFDMRDGFPACTTKRLAFGQVRAELAAFLHGAETVEEFNALGCSIWDANAASPSWAQRARFAGDAGRVYGAQWRRWRFVEAEKGKAPTFRRVEDAEAAGLRYRVGEVDQLRNLIQGLRADPHGRRHVVTTWQPGELGAICLPPCHIGFQCFASDEVTDEARPRGSLDLEFRMRSLDVFLGMPFDVASYALLLHLLAFELGRAPRWLLMTSGDTHLYLNHLPQVDRVLSRAPYPSPRLLLSVDASPLAFLPGDASLGGYECHAAVPAPMNV